MTAIFRREFKAYFTSPLGYIFLAVMYYFGGQFFSDVLGSGSSYIQYVFSSLFTTVMFVVPILTMRLMSEEKKQKTDQLLFTSPVNLSGIVIGKYLAAFVMYLLGIAITVLYVIIMATFTQPDWNILLGNFLGLLLVGASLIAIGLFVSSLTQSQMVSAVVTFAIMMFLFMFDSIAQTVPTDFLKKLFTQMSIMGRYNDFVSGQLNIAHVIFFVSVIVIFNFLTVRVLEKKRWS
ncbi:MAG: ABC transporter permease subunit [Oscillospiraceae bacterium]